MSQIRPDWNPVAEIRDERYFRNPQLWAIFLIPLGMGLLTLTFLIPDHFPFHYLGPIGTFALFMANYMPTVLRVIFYAAWASHGIEAWLAVKLCRQKGVHPDITTWWGVQTLFYGYFSLIHLVNFEPKKKL